MKRILAFILFFASFGSAFAQITPGGLPIGAGIDPYYMWRQPAPSCGSTTVRRTTVKSKHCESPWSHTAPNPIPLNEEYIFPSGTISPTYRTFLNTHTGILFTDSTKSSCNNFSASESLCNSATLKGKKKSGLGSSVYSAWAAFLNARTVNPQTIIQQVTQAIGAIDGYEFTRGCEWYEKRVDTMATVNNQCPVANMCVDANTRIMTLQMHIYAIEKELSQATDDAVKDKLNAEIGRLNLALDEAKLGCNAKMCILDDRGPSGVPGKAYASCIAKPMCSCPSPAGGIPENTLNCVPNPNCGMYTR